MTRPVRQAEIERWMMLNGEDGTPFLVLDDLPRLFAPGWPPLILINPQTGLLPADGNAIRERMKALQPAGKSRPSP